MPPISKSTNHQSPKFITNIVTRVFNVILYFYEVLVSTLIMKRLFYKTTTDNLKTKEKLQESMITNILKKYL